MPAPASVTATVLETYVEREVFERAPRRAIPRETKQEREMRSRLEKAERAFAEYRDSARVIEALGVERYAEGLQKRRRGVDRLVRFSASTRSAASGPACPRSRSSSAAGRG